ncbi:antitoxin Xre/MbcA/ParS toxin-binding domain-containing protein [Roseibium sp. RKSG952]|uniref:antitoxin Xre/MbcA/ParS toxin-binding domain-containing protein n=1 Tax=Roseibium sp. RKSG952 TaxID=2529384 RepID=UPI0012BC023F|nr:antitoxin Xre/MbcA/ParS toxin-binding domain-containing protein [Roseibium sp. RKSG952]MTH95536.1 DUF2384 domain-containing protein [Roseibium sp. RKSG952]
MAITLEDLLGRVGAAHHDHGIPTSQWVVWLDGPNDQLNGETPLDLIMRGETETVLKVIEERPREVFAKIPRRFCT